jgi:GDPmannose 4,6-dehydratase
MWRMLQRDEPEDYVLATGVPASVRDFLGAAFAAGGLDWREHVVFDPKYERPSEVHELVGDAAKARERLGWQPAVRWRELAELMVEADVEALDAELSGARVRIDR